MKNTVRNAVVSSAKFVRRHPTLTVVTVIYASCVILDKVKPVDAVAS